MICVADRDDNGFNLIELMVVVLILGILVVIAVASYTISIENARTVSCLSNQRTLDDAAIVYLARNGARPVDIEDLRPYASTFNKIVTCPADGDVKLTWNAATEEIECSIHPR